MFNAKITSIKKPTDSLWVFRIAMDDGVVPTFRAGQFTTIGLPDDNGKMILRAYSIVSAPTESELEFFIALVDGGQLTTKLFATNVGDSIFVGTKCVGPMSLDSVPPAAPILFVATGTGIAGFVSMLRDNAELGTTRRVALANGARVAADLVYLDELEQIAAARPNFKYFPAVSREEFRGHQGRINEVYSRSEFREFIPEFDENLHIFICGSIAMVDDQVSFFQTTAAAQNIHSEKY